MANEATSAPAPSAPAAPQSGDTPQGAAAPAEPAKVTPSEAARVLRNTQAIRDERKAKLAAPKEVAKSDPPKAATHVAPAAVQQTDSSRGSATENASGPTSGSAAETATGNAADESDQQLAALIREDRRIKAASKALAEREAALKDIETSATRVRAFDAAWAKGDHLGAIKQLVGGKAPADLVWDLLKEAEQTSEADETPDIDAIVEQKLAAREKAAQEARERAEAERRTSLETKLAAADEKVAPGFGRGVYGAVKWAERGIDPNNAEQVGGAVEAYAEYVGSVAKNLEAFPQKYPAAARLEIQPLRVVRTVERLWSELKRVPSTDETLAAIEKDLVGAFQATPYAAPAPEAKPSPTVTNGWKHDAGRPDAPAAKMDLDAKREARKRALMSRPS